MNILHRIAAAFDTHIDITPDLDTLALLDQPAACDKHRELIDAVAIAALQERIVANGGTVRVVPQEAEYLDDIVVFGPPTSKRIVKVHLVTPQEHAARRKGRKTQ